MRDVGPEGAPWGLSGGLDIGGTLSSPIVETRLAGVGSAQGALSARLEPGRYAALTSDLALGPVTSDLRLRWRLGELEAQGSVAYADYALSLDAANNGTDNTLVLLGNEKLAGWRGLLSAEEAQLTGELSSLSPQLGGALNLAVSWRPEVVVAGTLTGLEAGTLELGDLTLGSDNGGSEGAGGLERLTLQGDPLTASLDLQDTPRWTLSRLELPLSNGLAVQAQGQGTAQQGALSATLSGSALGEALDVPLALNYDAGTFSLQSQADLFSGTLNLDARYAPTFSGWTGQFDLTNLTLQGVSADLQGSLSGALTKPTLDGTLLLEQAQNRLAGTFVVSPNRVELEQRLVSPFLTEPLDLTGTALPLGLSVSTSPQNKLTLTRSEGLLAASGALAIGAGPAQVRFSPSAAAGGWLDLTLTSPRTPGLAFEGSLPSAPPSAWLSEVLRGFTLSGVQQTQGSVTLQAQPTPLANLADVRWQTDVGTLSLSGEATPGQTALQGSWQGAQKEPRTGTVLLPWLAEVQTLPFEVAVANSRAKVSAAGGIGTLDASFDWSTREAAFNANLTPGAGAIDAALRYTPEAGPSGDIQIRDLSLLATPDATLTLTTLLSADPRGLRGSGTLGIGTGQATVQGQLGWAQLAPEGLRSAFPQADDARTARLRLDAFNVAELPFVQRRLPNLDAPLNGVVQLNGAQVVGQFVSPELRVADTALPSQVELSGTLQNLEARASLGNSQLRVSYGGGAVAGFFDLEQFPLEILAEAATDASTVSASATGAARFEVPLAAPERSVVRLATEQLLIKREGAAEMTRGEVALTYDEGGLTVQRAEFRGGGFWRAQGRVTRDVLDLSLQAENADVTPLLSLVPRLAELGVGAQGSLSLTASGSLSEPQLELTSPALQLRLAGSSYRLSATKVTLNDENLDAVASLEGIAPIGGKLSLRGGGQLSLLPYQLNDFILAFDGVATSPVLGRVPGITGEVTADPAGWRLDSRAQLGQPVTLSGSLTPLNLTLQGDNLDVNAKNFFVASSATDVALDIARRGEDFVISGDVVVNTARLTPSRERTAAPDEAQSQPSETPEATSETASKATSTAPNDVADAALRGATVDPESDLSMTDPFTGPSAADTANAATNDADLAAVDTANAEASATDFLPTEANAAPDPLPTPNAPNPVLQQIIFNGVDFRAQSGVLFRAGFGSAELTFDLDLTGSAAAPELSGVARTLQGAVRFSGKDFTINEATATFTPSQGVFPTLNLAAQATFDKQDALGNLRNRYTFTEPRDGAAFSAELDVQGSFEEVSGRPRPVLDLEPSLSSDAVVQESGNGTLRPLEEPELVSLLTLGRLQLDTNLVGADSLAGTVAESALDTAVDFLVLSELQDALGDALGVGLFEIRTSALSSLLNGGEDDPFGVSLRVGGYIGEDLFASLEVGRFGDDGGLYALSNQFSIRYDLAPLELNLSGGLNFRDNGSAATEFDFSLGYSVTPLISLEAGLNASGADQSPSASARFGVSFTW